MTRKTAQGSKVSTHDSRQVILFQDFLEAAHKSENWADAYNKVYGNTEKPPKGLDCD